MLKIFLSRAMFYETQSWAQLAQGLISIMPLIESPAGSQNIPLYVCHPYFQWSDWIFISRISAMLEAMGFEGHANGENKPSIYGQ